MLFDGAEAELVGEPNRGLDAMFAMMNAARLGVGVQGVAQGARALRAGRGLRGGAHAGRPVHRRPSGRARGCWPRSAPITLAGRLLALEAGAALDRFRLAGDAAAEARVALLTPIVKAWCTDRGVDCASLGVQVHGGMGFVEDTGAAQVLRDARIAPIYEGTNGIQAIDLVARKVARDGGAAMRGLIAEARASDARLASGADALARATEWMLAATARDPAEAEASAAAYLDAAGWVLGGWMLARAAASDERYAPIAALLPPPPAAARRRARLAEIEAGDAVLALCRPAEALLRGGTLASAVLQRMFGGGDPLARR